MVGTTDLTTASEIKELARVYEDDQRGLLALLSGQLSVLKNQSQMLLGLSGLCITVTGFSGHNLVRSGPLGAITMAGGIGLILCGVVITLYAMAGLRWVTQDLASDVETTLQRVIPRRNAQQRALGLATGLAAVGFALYVVSVIYAALTFAEWTPPPG